MPSYTLICTVAEDQDVANRLDEACFEMERTLPTFKAHFTAMKSDAFTLADSIEQRPLDITMVLTVNEFTGAVSYKIYTPFGEVERQPTQPGQTSQHGQTGGNAQ